MVTRRRLRRREDGFEGDLRHREPPRHLLPLPPEQRVQQGFVFDPIRALIIAPWPKRAVSRADEARLLAVLDRIASLDEEMPCWVWPDDRAPVEVEAPDIFTWLQAWARDRATYAAA